MKKLLFAILLFSGCASKETVVDISTPLEALGDPYNNSLPGHWRPFADFSPWNIPLEPVGTGVPENGGARQAMLWRDRDSTGTYRSAPIHPLNDAIMATMTRTSNIRFGNSYLPPLWVVYNYDTFEQHFYYSDKIFDPFDCCPRDDISDTPMPIVREMYDEPTSDGHIIIYDKKYEQFFECSRFDWPNPGEPHGTTFNIWQNEGDGYGIANASQRWQLQGGRGSGVPIIGGLIRPEEIEYGVIRHALAFTFGDNRKDSSGGQMFISPPAARSDGKLVGEQYPIEGMRFQLDPDYDISNLNQSAQVVAQALRDYGAYLVDNGGDWAFQLQLLGATESSSRAEWDSRAPGLYTGIQAIPTNQFRVIYTGEPTVMN